MKKLLFIAVSLCLCLQLCYAQNVTDRSLLWRVSGKHIKTSYLFGTIHLICPGDYLWTDKMKQSLAQSDEACFEMNLSDVAILNEIAAGFIDNSGKTIKDYFTPADYRKLEAYMKDSLNSSIDMFQQLKPIALESMLSTKTAGCADPVSYEEKIMAEAQKARKTITGLEAPDEQIAVLESIPVDSVIKGIVDVVNGKATDDDVEYTSMIKAYKAQDLPALYALIMQSKDIANEMGIFLDDRNKKWISRLTAKMAQKSEFVAVGAGHLWGPNGLIRLLKQAGYTVEPVQ